MKKSILCLIAMGCAGQAFAYQVDAGAALQTSDYDDRFGFGGHFYFQGVQQSSGPLQEAAFLGQSNFVRANYIDYDAGNGIQAGGRFVDQNSGFFFDGNAYLGDLDGIEVGAGLYLNSNSTVGVTYFSRDHSDSFSGDYKKVIFQNNGTYINLEAGLQFMETDSFGQSFDSLTISVGGDYYTDKTLSFGAGLDLVSSDFQDVRVLSADATKFIASNISITGGVAFSDFEFSDSDVGVHFGGRLRF